MAVDGRSGTAPQLRKRSRLASGRSRIALLALMLLAVALGLERGLAGAPPEELRIGLLGERGVTFRDERPWELTEYASAAGDVDGDGMAEFLLFRWNPEADDEGEVVLVYGSRDPWPPAPTMAEVRAGSTVVRRTGEQLIQNDIFFRPASAASVPGRGLGPDGGRPRLRGALT